MESSAILVLRPNPRGIFSILHLRHCSNWFVELAGLLEQIAKVLVGAIEWQVTLKVPYGAKV